MKKTVPYIPIIAMMLLMLIFPKSSAAAAKSAMELVGSVIIPSLLPFFVCSGLLINSGACKRLSRITSRIMMPLFNVGGAGSAALVLGLIGGYPQGAVTVCSLYENGYLSKSEAERLLAFCNNSGPLFILGAVGDTLYSAQKIGVLLYASHILAAITVGFIFRFYKMGSHHAPQYRLNRETLTFSESFSEAIRGAAASMLTICTSVIFFAVFSDLILRFLPSGSMAKAFFSGILELSGGVRAISRANGTLSSRLALSSFCIGFAGFCVHLQVAAISAKAGLSLLPYIAGKALQGCLSFAYTSLFLRIFGGSVPAFSACSPVFSGCFLGSAYTLLGVLLIFLISALPTALLKKRSTQRALPN